MEFMSRDGAARRICLVGAFALAIGSLGANADPVQQTAVVSANADASAGAAVRADPVAELADAIAARLALMDDVARYKWNHEQRVADPERESAVLDRVTTDAVALGVPQDYAHRVVGAQIDAARMRQVQLFAVWRTQPRTPFPNVPDLATVQRPAIDAATRSLITRLRASMCELDSTQAHAALERPPQSMRADVWSLAVAALWPAPACAASPRTAPAAAPQPKSH
jgi:chorismate mutase-like protein